MSLLPGKLISNLSPGKIFLAAPALSQDTALPPLDAKLLATFEVISPDPQLQIQMEYARGGVRG